MTFTKLSSDQEKAYRRYQSMRREVIRLKINHAANEGVVELLTLLEGVLANNVEEHGELLAQLVSRRAELYRSLQRSGAGRAWFGEKASNSLHHTGLLETT